MKQIRTPQTPHAAYKPNLSACLLALQQWNEMERNTQSTTFCLRHATSSPQARAPTTKDANSPKAPPNWQTPRRTAIAQLQTPASEGVCVLAS